MRFTIENGQRMAHLTRSPIASALYRHFRCGYATMRAVWYGRLGHG